MNLRGKRALVMGLGIHGGGLGVARFLASQGADVTVTDMRPAELLQPSLDALAGLPIRFVLGQHDQADFRNAELVVRNPAVPASSPYLQIARAAGAQIEMEMTLFFRLCPGPILGITGTKGKTTTTLLTGALLRQAYPNTVVAGNLRVSALEALPQITASTPVVLELSSFALEGLGEAGLSPQYACITNISADHLDRYDSMEAYAAAKRQILLHQRPTDVLVLNQQDALSAAWAATAPGAVTWFAAQQDKLAQPEQPTVFYGERGLAWFDPARVDAAADNLYMQPLCGPEDVALPGQHNLANVAAAAALAKAFGVENSAIRAAVRGFSGVEHRLELVRTLGGVRYVNDTAATAPEAAIAALSSVSTPIILIAGGADKNLPFTALAQAIVQRARALVLLQGSATEKLLAIVQSLALRVQNFEQQSSTLNSQFLTIIGPYNNFAEAIAAARALASPGDTVLLSPGCASFGMFRNEFHRGEEFRRIVMSYEL